jgi:hypothetical protein
VASSCSGNPYNGHTLRDVIDHTQKLTGREIEGGYVDKGYRGHDTQAPRRVFFSGQKRGVFGIFKRELDANPRSAISRPTVISAAAISNVAPATLPTPSSPQKATTSAAPSHG